MLLLFWARAWPPPEHKKTTQTVKKKHTWRARVCAGEGGGEGRVFLVLLFGRAEERACYCLFAVWAGVRVFFAVWAGWGETVYFFCCWGGPGRRRVFFFAVWAGCRVFLALWAGRGEFCFFLCGLGRGREFTHLPVCLARLYCKGPNNNKDQTAKTKQGFPS